MAATLTVALINNAASVTLTYSSITSFADAKAAAQQLVQTGGFFADNGNFYPTTAVLSVSIAVS